MSKISNTTAYPNIIPTVNDYVILTDVNDNNETKTAKVSQFQESFGVSTLETTLIKSDIEALFSNPKILLTCNAGEYIQPICSVIKYIYAGGGYAFNTDIELRMGPGTTNAIHTWPANTLFTGIQNVVAWSTPTASHEYGNAAGGDPLTIGAKGFNPSGGNGTMTINVQYRIVKF